MRPSPADTALEGPHDAAGAQPENRLDELVFRLAGLLEDVTDTGPLDLREPLAD